MRIIAGKFKGLKFPNFTSKEIRPTTDRSKEAIFAFLENNLNFNEIHVLDLFAGSGTVSIELLSRECKSVTSIDKGKESIEYLSKLKKQLCLSKEWSIEQNDVLRYLKQNSIHGIHLIFADPPYNMPSLHQFVTKVINNMDEDTLFLVEHKPAIQFATPYLKETKSFGKSCISIFSKVPLN